jgi:hypothetical protein
VKRIYTQSHRRNTNYVDQHHAPSKYAKTLKKIKVKINLSSSVSLIQMIKANQNQDSRNNCSFTLSATPSFIQIYAVAWALTFVDTRYGTNRRIPILFFEPHLKTAIRILSNTCA